MERELSITYMSGPLDGKTLRFEQPDVGDELILNIGRREGCDIHLPFDNQVSRLHARLGCVSTPVTASDSVAEPYHPVVLAGRHAQPQRDVHRARERPAARAHQPATGDALSHRADVAAARRATVTLEMCWATKGHTPSVEKQIV